MRHPKQQGEDSVSELDRGCEVVVGDRVGWEHLAMKVNVKSRSGIDLLLAKNVGARGVFGFAPTPLGNEVSH